MSRAQLSTVRLVPALAAAAVLAACASTPAPTPRTAAAPAPSRSGAPVRPGAARPLPAPITVAPHERIRRAVELLGKGQHDAARAEVLALLAEQPGHPTGKLLLDQIDKDPRVLLGERNFSYKIKPGESLSILAERYLGDPLMFYALARYNGIEAPDSAEAGRSILIPGAPKKAAPAPAQAAAASKPAPPATNPARANSLRRAALVNLNKGAVDRAVAQLQEAEPLDPANALIRNDLARARRIQAELKRR